MSPTSYHTAPPRTAKLQTADVGSNLCDRFDTWLQPDRDDQRAPGCHRCYEEVMPFSHAPSAEPIQTPPEYGISEVGAEHATLEQLAERFASERTWWIATARPDGRPHAVPIWGVRCEGHLIFGTDPRSVKTKNLVASPHASLHLESGDKVAILECTVEHLPADKLPASFVATYKDKYDIEMDPTDPGALYYRAAPVTLLSWDEADFVNTAARWRFSV